MASTSGKQSTPLEKLFNKPDCFDFYQAVRMLSLSGVEEKTSYALQHMMIGGESSPDLEFIRFKTSTNSNFPLGLIESVKEHDGYSETTKILEMVVSFMGLTGPMGILPQHYSELVAKTVAEGNPALKDFFDLFNHRLISLLYLAWDKYNHFTGYERAKKLKTMLDPVTELLMNFSGIGMPALQNRLGFDDEISVHYAGIFSRQIRSAETLEHILTAYFQLPIQVLQLQGKWLYLAKSERSTVTNQQSEYIYNKLGVNFVLGERYWNAQNMFRVYIGPVNYTVFKSILPSGKLLKSLVEMIRFYCGLELDFDIQVELIASETPPLQLNCLNPPSLGWNTWIKNKVFNVNPNQLVLSSDKSFL